MNLNIQFDHMGTVRIMEFNAVIPSEIVNSALRCIRSFVHVVLKGWLFTDGFVFADSQAGVKMGTYGCIISILSTLQ